MKKLVKIGAVMCALAALALTACSGGSSGGSDDEPSVPSVPVQPENPGSPDSPDVPENPDVPEDPDTPDVPDNPDNPPAQPRTPAEWVRFVIGAETYDSLADRMKNGERMHMTFSGMQAAVDVFVADRSLLSEDFINEIIQTRAAQEESGGEEVIQTALVATAEEYVKITDHDMADHAFCYFIPLKFTGTIYVGEIYPKPADPDYADLNDATILI